MKRIALGMLLALVALPSTGCLIHTGPARPVVVHDHSQPVIVEHDHHHDSGKHKGWEKHHHGDDNDDQ